MAEANNVLCVLYLLYPSGKRYRKETPIRALKNILSRLRSKYILIYINNAEEGTSVRKISDREYEIGGDNSFFEFSGWQKGIDFVKQNNIPCEAFLFVNDTFLESSFLHRQLINQQSVECAIRHQALVGKKMFSSVSGTIMGNALDAYIRTHIFITSSRVINSLKSIVSINTQTVERFFVDRYQPGLALFKENAPLSEEIKNFIFSHVTSVWRRKKTYDAESFQLLRGKAASILNSFLLSIRAKQWGYPLISYGKVKFVLSQSMSLGQIKDLWSYSPADAGTVQSTSNNRFWLRKIPFYRHLPKKSSEFTLEDFENILDSYSKPTHL